MIIIKQSTQKKEGPNPFSSLLPHARMGKHLPTSALPLSTTTTANRIAPCHDWHEHHP